MLREVSSRVLLVEDDDMIARPLVRTLEREGYDVDHVAQGDAPLQRNANEALEEVRRAAQALKVLSDYLQRHPESLLRGKPKDPDVNQGRAR